MCIEVYNLTNDRFEGKELKKKIALFIRGFHNGGIEKVFENYYSHMNLNLFEIHIFTHMKNDTQKKEYFEKLGCVVHELSSMKGNSIKLINIKEYKRIFKENQFDVVHNNMPDFLLPLYFACKNKVPVRILHSHSVYGMNSNKKNHIKSFIYSLGFHINSGFATKLIAVSQEAADAVFPKGDKRIEFLYNAIDLSNFLYSHEKRQNIRHVLMLEDSVVLGHVGRYESTVKNQGFLIDVFRKIYEKDNHYKLIMIGDGKLKNHFVEKVKEYKLENAVIFTGNIGNVNDYLMAMDCFLLPSKQEGLGIAAIEAQAAGLPCIVSDLVPREVNATGDVVFCSINAEDSLLKWIDLIMKTKTVDKDARLKKNYIVKKAGFDISTQAKKLETIYLS